MTAKEACTRCVYEKTEGSHLLRIEGYSLAKGIGPKKPISSEVFTIGGYNWAIFFFPDGSEPEDQSSHVSAYIALKSDDQATNIRAVYRLTLIDQSGEENHKIFGGGPCRFNFVEGPWWGYKRFMLRSELESSNYIKNDCIIIRGTVGIVRIVRSINDKPNKYAISIPRPKLGRCLKKLLQSGVGSDIVFSVGEQTFNAHKVILAARSPVFQAQFFGLLGSPDLNRVVVEDMDPTVFKALLNFIYCDSVSDFNKSLSSWPSTSLIFLQNLLGAADRYGIDRLKLLCEYNLSEKVAVDTVATILVVAEQHSCKRLKHACLNFAVSQKNLQAVMMSEGYEYLRKTFPDLLSELLHMVASSEKQ